MRRHADTDPGRRGFLLGAAGLALAGTAAAPPAGPGLGPGRLLPDDSPWNQDVSKLAVDPSSDAIVRGIGVAKPLHPAFGTVYDGVPNGIPFVTVSKGQPRVPMRFEIADESDPGPYPIPPDAPIEGGPGSTGDRHVLVFDRDAGKLYELCGARREGAGWFAGGGAVFDLKSNAQRPAGWTSADAAGLPILPGLARYEEAVAPDGIRHALRFTVQRTRRAYVAPARHFASDLQDPKLPPMGARFRLKASFNVDKLSPQARAIATALKRYGMFLADNGSDWFLNGAPDPRWDDGDLATLKRIKGSDFELVKMGKLVLR